MKATIVAIIAATLLPAAANAWDGYDYDKGRFVEIERGNLVRQGREIEVYEYGAGYKTFEVDSVRRSGSSVEIEVIDTETGESRTFDMDDR